MTLKVRKRTGEVRKRRICWPRIVHVEIDGKLTAKNAKTTIPTAQRERVPSASVAKRVIA